MEVFVPKRKSLSYFSRTKFVKELTPEDFQDIQTFKLKNKSPTIVMFYAPWCGYCKRSKDVWKKLGDVATFVHVTAFNCEKYKDHVDKMNVDKKEFIRSFPTIILYKKGVPVKKFNGDRNLKELLTFCCS